LPLTAANLDPSECRSPKVLRQDGPKVLGATWPCIDVTAEFPDLPDTPAVSSASLTDRFRLPLGGRRIPPVAVLALVVVLAVGAVVAWRIGLRLTHVTGLEAVPPNSTLPVPAESPIVVVMLENKTEAQIHDAADAPYLQHLLASGAEMTDYQGVAHPSQPNYLALFSGSTQGVFDDHVHDVDAPTLADQLEAAGKTWRIFAENYPGGCFTGASATGGPDGDGTYVRKHVPAISFRSIAGSPARCANIQPLASFEPDAADFMWIVPNLCHDMHDCPIASGDRWLASFVPRILDSPAFRPGGHGLLIVTFDERDGNDHNGEIVTVLVGPDVRAGTTSGIAHSHYSLLRTIETSLGLPCLADACEANTLGEAFGR